MGAFDWLFGKKPAATPSTGISTGVSTTPSLGLTSTSTQTTPAPSKPSNILSIVGTVLGAAFLILLAVVAYNYFRRRTGQSEISLWPSSTSSGDKTPAPVDGTKKFTIPAAEVPVGGGLDSGMQFWMFIKDWDHKFGQQKEVIKRVQGTDASPFVTLHPTDNTLQVRVSIYPNSPSAGAASVPTSSSTGDSFTCSVENVPLQTWFSVSITIFQRNLEIYINGRLVKSCVLPGIPKPVSGDVIIGDNDGFSGSICNFNSYGSMLSPGDAQAFFAAGTNCQAPTPSKASAVDKDSVFITIFGYTFRFSTLDKTGKELSSYVL